MPRSGSPANGSLSAPHVFSLSRKERYLLPLHQRQEDLLFLQQDMRPAASLVAQPSTVILAGEAPGHAHRIQAGTIQSAPDGALDLDITHVIQVVYEEQGPIMLEPGLLLAGRELEYRPEAIRMGTD